MKAKKLLLAIIALSSFSAAYAQFPQWPQTSVLTKPGARWWWMGSAID